MPSLNIVKFKRKTKKLTLFLKKIKEKQFQINKSYKNTPWIHLNDLKFTFYKFKFYNKIIGLAAVIKMKTNTHLQFFYIGKNYRCKGFGSEILNKILPKKKLTTVHVPKKLSQRTENFYIKNRFILSRMSENNYKIKYWIRRCIKFDKNTFFEKKLLYKNLN